MDSTWWVLGARTSENRGCYVVTFPQRRQVTATWGHDDLLLERGLEELALPTHVLTNGEANRAPTGDGGGLRAGRTSVSGVYV